MSAIINITPSELWKYFEENIKDLESYMHLIASNDDYGVKIYVTDDYGMPNIVVSADEEIVYEETAVSPEDCENVAKNIYNEYLTEKAFTNLTQEYIEATESQEDMDIDEIISERETELDSAVYEFVMNIMCGSYIDDTCEDFEDMLEDLKEHFLEYMARKHGLPIYRPMILEYDDGSEELSDFPYDDMEFDDEDNPIYK